MEGMKKIICAGIQLCEAVLNEFGFQQETIRPELVLTNQEILDLIDKLNGCPYDVPSLDDYEPNASGIFMGRYFQLLDLPLLISRLQRKA